MYWRIKQGYRQNAPVNIQRSRVALNTWCTHVDSINQSTQPVLAVISALKEFSDNSLELVPNTRKEYTPVATGNFAEAYKQSNVGQ